MRFKASLAAVVMLLLVQMSTLQGATSSKRVTFANDTWIPVGITQEGIVVKEVRFSAVGGANLNPLRGGVGPQAFVAIKNTSDHGMHVAVAVAFFDANGGLIGAAEGNNTGVLDPTETSEIKITFGYVKREIATAKSAQIAVETWR